MIYDCKYQCDYEYLGRINQKLEARIDQHVHVKIRRGQYENLRTLVNNAGSATAENFNK